VASHNWKKIAVFFYIADECLFKVCVSYYCILLGLTIETFMFALKQKIPI